ncbi:MAG: cupin domain-containing protein [Betaproteobacteria bacterium]|nr:cupin domain-containing protein [Betaproteobacteria bacterium]
MRGHHSKALNAAQRAAGPGASQPEVDAFVDHLWLEAGLAQNSLAAYRRDLSIYAAWLDGRALHSSTEADVQRFFASQHAHTKATTANRRLTVLKRYFRWALREGAMQTDPTLKLQAAKQALRVPKTLSEFQVEALLAAPDTETPLGLRDRTMLELMYASGLRVSELVSLRSFELSMNDGVLRVMGKGSKERLVPYEKDSMLQANIHHIAPGGSSDGVIVHAGEEMGVLLRGTLELQVDQETYLLHPGDSFHFRSERPHGYRNAGTEPVEVVWVSTPPTF